MSNKKGLLIILSGPSGVGKGTVRKKMMEDSDLNLFYSISMTTRSPRAGEVDGVDYYFVSPEQFEENIKNNNLLEWCEFVGNKYGTPKNVVEQLRNEGKNVFLEIEVNGANQVMKIMEDDPDFISIFLMPPSFKTLEARIRNRRTEEESVVQERLKKSKREMRESKNYDYVILNDRVNRAAEELAEIILKHINKDN